MTRRRILGLAALMAAFGLSLAMPSDAHARRWCYGRRVYRTTYTYAAPAAGNCAPTTAPVNPDGTMAPQPGNGTPPPAPAPPSAAYAPPAPQGAFN